MYSYVLEDTYKNVYGKLFVKVKKQETQKFSKSKMEK